VIGTLDTRQSDSVLVFEELKNGLAAPLNGMGTAFSSSLMGLAGSLILGFLDLQASHAQNRFYNELEEWLSGITELTPAGDGAAAEITTRHLHAAIYDMQRAIGSLAEQIEHMGRTPAAPPTPIPPPLPASAVSDPSIKELAHGVDQLVRQMRAEQQVVREWVDEQASRQSEVASALKELAETVARRGG
jgi:methyl-accepting chemotaxis protein